MAHELATTKQGETMMAYFGRQPWHLLGQEATEPMTRQTALQLSHTDFELVEKPLATIGDKAIDGIPVIGQAVSSHKAILNGTTNEILGIVGSNYETISNSQLMDFMDSLIGEGNLQYHTIALFGGKRFFVSAKVPTAFLENIGVKNYANTEKYIVLSSSHDGTMAMHLLWTDIRVVCNNTLSVALGTALGSGKVKNVKSDFTVKHTVNYRENLEEARKALEVYGIYQLVLDKIMDMLLHTPFSNDGMISLAKNIMPQTQDEPSTTTIRRRSELVNLFDNGIKHNDIANTGFAALQAVTQYSDHVAKTRDTGRNADEANFNRQIWGSGSTFKQKGFNYLAKTLITPSFSKELNQLATA